MDVNSRIEDLKKKHDAAKVAHLRAQAAKESADKVKQDLWDKISATFSIYSVEEAKELLAEKSARVTELLAEAEEKLKDA